MLRRAALRVTLGAAVITPIANAQDAPAGATTDAARRGHRAGRTAADTTPVRGYVVVGALTGFVGGALGFPFWASNAAAVGSLALVPFAWTVAVAGKRSRAAPTLDLAARIQSEPEAYQEAFRASYAQRLAQRRRRAAIIGGVGGVLVGAAAFVGLVVAAISTAGT
jgi:hypothetical protein